MKKNMTLAAALALTGLAAACDVAKVQDEKGRKLSLVAPAAQSLAQGETNKILVAVSRTGVAGPLRVEFSGLPRGVTVVESPTEIAGDASTGTFTLHAANDAEIAQGHQATVTALGPEGMSVSERFAVDVVAAKPK